MYQPQYKNQAVTNKKKKKNTDLCIKNFRQITHLNFFYVDIYGNRKLRLNQPINNKIVSKGETSKDFSTCSRNLNGISTA